LDRGRKNREKKNCPDRTAEGGGNVDKGGKAQKKRGRAKEKRMCIHRRGRETKREKITERLLGMAKKRGVCGLAVTSKKKKKRGEKKKKAGSLPGSSREKKGENEKHIYPKRKKKRREVHAGKRRKKRSVNEPSQDEGGIISGLHLRERKKKG